MSIIIPSLSGEQLKEKIQGEEIQGVKIYETTDDYLSFRDYIIEQINKNKTKNTYIAKKEEININKFITQLQSIQKNDTFTIVHKNILCQRIINLFNSYIKDLLSEEEWYLIKFNIINFGDSKLSLEAREYIETQLNKIEDLNMLLNDMLTKELKNIDKINNILIYIIYYLVELITNFYDNNTYIYNYSTLNYFIMGIIYLLIHLTIYDFPTSSSDQVYIKYQFVDTIVNQLNNFEQLYIWLIKIEDSEKHYMYNKLQDIYNNLEPHKQKYDSIDFNLFNIIYHLTLIFRKKNNQFRIKGQLPIIIFEDVFNFFKDENYDIYLQYIFRKFNLIRELYEEKNKDLDKLIISFIEEIENINDDSDDDGIKLLYIYIKYLLLRNIIYSIGIDNSIIQTIIELFNKSTTHKLEFIINYLNEIFINNELLVNIFIYNFGKDNINIKLYYDTPKTQIQSSVVQSHTPIVKTQSSSEPSHMESFSSNVSIVQSQNFSQSSSQIQSKSQSSSQIQSKSSSQIQIQSKSQELSTVMTTRKGIENVGNTCFFNSGLQLLYSIPEFKDLLLELKDSLVQIPESNAKKIIQNLIGLIKKLSDAEKSSDRCINPHPEIDAIFDTYMDEERLSEKKIKFRKGTQNDASEYVIMKIFNALDFLKISVPSILILSEILKLFNFDSVDLISCSVNFIGTREKERFSQTITSPYLNFPIYSTIQQSIHNFLEQERVSNTNCIGICHKQVKLTLNNKYLIIMLTIKDKSQSCHINGIININKDYFCLLGSVLHVSSTFTGGHYVYISFDGNGSTTPTFVYNDSSVYQTNHYDINKDSYILLYRKMENLPPVQQPGGSINTISKENNTISKENNSKWKNKYLKYKQKYFNLAKEI